MPMQQKTITITEQMENWVKAQVDSGKYENDSEYFRDLLRKDQEKREAEFQLRIMLDKAEADGISDRNPKEIWEEAENRFTEKNG